MNCNFITNGNTAFIFVFEVLQLNIFILWDHNWKSEPDSGFCFVLKVMRVEKKTIDMNQILKDYSIFLKTLV